MDVGLIGLGHMGAPMARNLLKAGHHLIVYNRTRSKVEALREGAQIADRVAVVFGDRGALFRASPRYLHISEHDQRGAAP